jgi:hypothetical protein
MQEMIEQDTEFVAADAEDNQGRSLLQIAEGHDANSDLCAAVRKLILFFGRYKINKGPAAHKSATCLVCFAESYEQSLQKGSTHATTTPVALKFMKHKDQYERELRMRKEQHLEQQFVVHVIGSHSADDDSDFSKAIAKLNECWQLGECGLADSFLCTFPNISFLIRSTVCLLVACR